LPECTRTRERFAHARAFLLVTALLMACAWFAASARADGDPASDVLSTQSLFLPQDAGVSTAQQRQLQTLLEEASRGGEPIRVAVIASPADLGSITELWRQPQSYARFLGQELSLVYQGPLLVVMPDGYGIFKQAGLSGAQRAAVVGSPAPGAKPGSATLGAVERLAASSGRALALPRAGSQSAGGSGDPLPWIVFAIGAAFIGLAWTASLRARPLGRSA
jgi:hypothetical protein